MKTTRILLLVVTLLTTAASAQSILFDNTDVSWSSSRNISGLFYQAQSFTTGSTETTLDLISLNLIAPPTQPNSSTVVQLYSGLYPGLGGLVDTLVGPQYPSTGLVTYTPSTTITLAANHTYWIAAHVGYNDIGAYWVMADSNPTVGSGQGSRMYYRDIAQWIAAGPGDYEMLVQVQPVPEPSVLAVLVLGVVCLLGHSHIPRLLRLGR